MIAGRPLIMALSLAAAGAGVLSGPAAATPQLSAPEVERPRPALRVPPIDLKELAKKPRPGQVMPLDKDASGTPGETKPATDPASPAVEEAAKPKGPTRTVPISNGPVTNVAPERQDQQQTPVAAGPPLDAIAQRYRDMARPDASILVLATLGDGTEIRRVVIGQSRVSDSWRDARGNDTLLGTAEVRTSGTGGLDLRIGDDTTVRVDRLSRVRVGKMDTQTGDPTSTRTVIELLRGRVEVRPLNGTTCMVATPDSIIIVRDALDVWYDTSLGTRSRPSDTAATTSKPAATAPQAGPGPSKP